MLELCLQQVGEVGKGAVNTHGHGEIQMSDSENKIEGWCHVWDYPYTMQFGRAENKFMIQLANNAMEFDTVGSEPLLVVRCRQISQGRWFSSPKFSIEHLARPEFSWVLIKNGWMGVKVQCPARCFKASYRKKLQVLDGKWKLELSRKGLILSWPHVKDIEPPIEMLVALAYFLWVRYTRMCES